MHDKDLLNSFTVYAAPSFHCDFERLGKNDHNTHTHQDSSNAPFSKEPSFWNREYSSSISSSCCMRPSRSAAQTCSPSSHDTRVTSPSSTAESRLRSSPKRYVPQVWQSFNSGSWLRQAGQALNAHLVSDSSRHLIECPVPFSCEQSLRFSLFSHEGLHSPPLGLIQLLLVCLVQSLGSLHRS